MAVARTTRIVDDPAGPTRADFTRWVRKHGGHDLGLTRLIIVAQGNSSSTVVVTGIRPVVVTRQPAPPTVSLEFSPFRWPASSAPIRTISADLARPNEVVQEDESGRHRPRAISLKRQEVEVWDCWVSLRSDDLIVSWTLEVRAVVDGAPVTMIIDDAGRPFRTYGLSDKRRSSQQFTSRANLFTWSGDRWAARTPRN